MKKFLVLSLSVLLLSVTAVFADQGIVGNKIKVGGVLPLSGGAGFIGDGVRIGMETYIRYFNNELKYGGKQIEGYFLDDGFVAEKGLAATKELIENKKVFALVGTTGTPGIMAAMDIILKKGLPFVYQGSGVAQLYLPPKRNVFPIQPSFIFEGRIFVKFLADQLGKKRIAVVYRNDEVGEGLLVGLNEILPTYKRKGVSIVEKIPVAATDTDLNPTVVRIKNSNPDAIIIYLYGGQATGFVRSAREAGMDPKNIPMVTTYVNSDPVMFKLAGSSWNDVLCGAWASPTTGDYYKNFMRVWKQYSGLKNDPSPYNIAGWIAMETFVEGLKRVKGNLTWESYIKAMETFSQGGGWSGGMAYKISYKPFNKNDKTCRFPQAYMYFVKGVKKEYQVYKKAKSLADLFIPAY